MRREFEKKVETFLKEKNLIAPGERVLIGLSGGADSVCLAVVLQRLAKKSGFFVGAFHVNHEIRGAEADRDERFSEALCKQLGIPFFAVHEPVPKLAEEWKTGLEEAGRRVRYEAAERIADEQGYDKIALAHHRNDAAETLLFHLFRGSSVEGLASIPEQRGRIVRPLLLCERKEIEAYLSAEGISYCVDGTNEDTEYARNKIRHNILPVAEEVNQGAVRHMAETAAEFSELSEYLAGETERVFGLAECSGDGIVLPITVLETTHRVLRRRVIYRCIETVAGRKKDITKEHVEAVLGLSEKQSGRQVSLPYGLMAVREFDRLYIGKRKNAEVPEESCEVMVPGEYPLGEPGETVTFRLFAYEKNTEIPKNEYTKWFDYDKIKGTLYLRTYHTGDRLGMQTGSKSVKSVWVEHKVPAEERKRRLLLADEEQVLWIPGVRCCDNYRIDETTKTVLEVQRNGGK